MSKSKAINVRDLFLVDFYCETTGVPQDLRRWTNSKLGSYVFNAENCARHIWFGEKEDFQDCPDLTGYDRYRLRTGGEAYAFLLKFMLGLVNPDGLDAPAGQRFFIAWSKISGRNPQQARRMSDLILKLTEDYGFIKSNVYPHILSDRPWMVARDLSGQKKDDSLLIVGDCKGNGELTDATCRLLTTSNGATGKLAKVIRICVPPLMDQSKIEESILHLIGEGKLRVSVEVVPMEDFSKEIECADVVYSGLPTGKYPDLDIVIAEAWQGRIRQDNILVQSYPAGNRVSSDAGPYAALTGFVSNETICAEAKRRSAEYIRWQEIACRMADVCAQARSENKNMPHVGLRQILSAPVLMA